MLQQQAPRSDAARALLWRETASTMLARPRPAARNTHGVLTDLGRRAHWSTGSFPAVGVLALFRDEAMYLTEWLTHYAAEGVTQFVLLDQSSADNGVELVLRFAQQHPWLNVSLHAAPEPRQQNRHYARHLHRLTTDWVLIVDIDEFVYARLEFATLPQYLLNLTRVQPAAGMVAIPWKVFGAFTKKAYQIMHPVSVISNLTLRHSIGRNKYPLGTVEYKSLLRLSALRAHLGLAPAASLVEDVLPKGPSSSPELHLHHAVEGLRTVLPDGTELDRHRARATAGSQRDGRRPAKVTNLTEQIINAWPVHLNHYRLGSCEFWYRVKLMRGDAADLGPRGSGLVGRDWSVFREINRYASREEDLELRGKRGGTSWAASLAVVHREWPRYVSRRRDPANGGRSLRARSVPPDCQRALEGVS